MTLNCDTTWYTDTITLALAVVAIIIAIGESIKSNNKELKSNTAIDTILSNVSTMNTLVNKLEKDIDKITQDSSKTLTHLEKYEQFYTNPTSVIAVEPKENDNSANITEDNVNPELNPESKDYNTSDSLKDNPTIVIKDTNTQAIKLKTIEDVEEVIENNLNNPKLNKYPICKRGDIFLANLGNSIGSEKGGYRPVLIVQNDTANRFSNHVTILPITALKMTKTLPTHVILKAEKFALNKDSIIQAEQIRTIDKSRLIERIDSLGSNTMEKVDKAILIQNGIIE